MILVIDTSSPIAAVAGIEEGGLMTESLIPARSPELVARLRAIARSHTITKVAVATGPGSFTGLRAGVSFGLGLAMGLRVPIVPLPTLELQAARSDDPLTAVVDAGRGRFFYLFPGRDVALGSPAEIPKDHELVGRLEHREVLLDEGHVLRSEDRLRPFAKAAARLLETASEVPYRSLRIEYMQSFSAHH